MKKETLIELIDESELSSHSKKVLKNRLEKDGNVNDIINLMYMLIYEHGYAGSIGYIKGYKEKVYDKLLGF